VQLGVGVCDGYMGCSRRIEGKRGQGWDCSVGRWGSDYCCDGVGAVGIVMGGWQRYLCKAEAHPTTSRRGDQHGSPK
jgi:hypothetical protein